MSNNLLLLSLILSPPYMGVFWASLVVVCMPNNPNQLGLCDCLPKAVDFVGSIRRTHRFNTIAITALPSAQISGRQYQQIRIFLAESRHKDRGASPFLKWQLQVFFINLKLFHTCQFSPQFRTQLIRGS